MADPPNAASVALIDGHRVLLIQRAREPYKGLWTLPGGRLEPGETAETAAARELKEELGISVSGLLLVTRLTLDEGPFRLQVFASGTFEGEIVPSDEIADWRWATADQVAGLPVTPHLPEVIAATLALLGRR